MADVTQVQMDGGGRQRTQGKAGKKKGAAKERVRKPFFSGFEPLVAKWRKIFPKRGKKAQKEQAFKYTFEEKRDDVEPLLKKHDKNFSGKVLNAKPPTPFKGFSESECFQVIIDPQDGSLPEYGFIIFFGGGGKPVTYTEKVPENIAQKDLPGLCFPRAAIFKSMGELFISHNAGTKITLEAFRDFIAKNTPRLILPSEQR